MNTRINKYKRLLKNIGLLLAGNFVTKVLSFLMVPFYTSILSTSDYGVADLISTTVLLALPVFSALMDEAIMRFALDVENDKKQVFSIAVVISTVGFIIAICISPIILFVPTLKPYYWFVILYYISLWIYNIFSNYVKGLDKISITTTAGIIHTFFYLGINILCLSIFKFGVYGYLLAIDLSNLIAAAYLFFYCKLYRNFISIKKLDWKMGKAMLRYAVPMIPDYISWWINNASDRYILALFCGASEIGIYSVAYKIPTILNSLTNIFSSAWKISSVDDFGSDASIAFYNKTYRLYSGFIMIGAAGLIFFTKILATLLFAKEFYAAWKITPILILAYVFSAQAIFIGSIFTASKKTKMLFFSSTAGAILNIILNFVLIPRLGGSGAAIATSLGYATILIINIIITRKILPINFCFLSNISVISLLVVEIIAVLQNSLVGYIIAILCLGIIVVIKGREFLYFGSYLLRKIKNKE